MTNITTITTGILNGYNGENLAEKLQALLNDESVDLGTDSLAEIESMFADDVPGVYEVRDDKEADVYAYAILFDDGSAYVQQGTRYDGIPQLEDGEIMDADEAEDLICG